MPNIVRQVFNVQIVGEEFRVSDSSPTVFQVTIDDGIYAVTCTEQVDVFNVTVDDPCFQVELQEAIQYQVTLQGVSGGTGDVTYVRPAPSYVSVGGIVAGVTAFDGTLADALDKMLYPYLEPVFSAFSISGQATSLEVGDTAADGVITFSWATSSSGNVEPNTIDIQDVTGAANLITDTANDGSENYDNGAGVSRATAGAYQWRISGEDTEGGAFSRNFNVNWYWRFHWGSSSISTATGNEVALVAALLNDALYSSRNRTYICDANNYKWVLWPTIYGLASVFRDAETGFAVPMEAPETVTITNTFGVSQTYYAYRTTNQVVGTLQIEVT